MNEEDDLLNSLAAHQRDDHAAWQATLLRLGLEETLLARYAAGGLDDGELEALRARGAADDEVARILSAYAPLGERFQERLLEKIEATAAIAAVAPAGASVTTLQPPARKRRWRPAIAIPSALAAGLLVALLLPSLLTGPAQRSALPGYVLQVSGMTAQLRADPGEAIEVTPTAARPAALHLAPGNQLRLQLTPATAIGAEIDAALYLQELPGAEPISLSLDPALLRTSPSGAVRIQALIGEQLELPRGDVRLLVVVGAAQALPRAEELSELLGDAGGIDGGDWQAFALDLTVAE